MSRYYDLKYAREYYDLKYAKEYLINHNIEYFYINHEFHIDKIKLITNKTYKFISHENMLNSIRGYDNRYIFMICENHRQSNYYFKYFLERLNNENIEIQNKILFYSEVTI